MEVTEIKVSYSTRKGIKFKVNNSSDAYNLVLEKWNKDLIELQEEMKVILLNRANIVLGIFELSKGGTNSTVVDVKLILSVALKCNAHSIIMCHNHPSGNLKASKADIEITNKVKKACSYFDIILLDHLIITKEEYSSFIEEGLL
ncbi:JAB domain-containing protein [Tenacibaculum aestuarii]|uniref:JAB domain-containing protein n=1 Tax=Tenacibaculum aestuarii TaxID=362781 RepID=UPI00389366DA